jgi:hypothetical protein
MGTRPRPVKARWAWRIILLAGLLAIAGRIGWTIVFPHPSGASAAALGRWLVMRDLSGVGADTQLALVDRLQDLLGDQDVMDAFPEPSPDQLERLVTNVDLLSRVWFLARARRYQEIPDNQRMEYLQRQVDAVMVWGEFDNQVHQERRRQAGLEPSTDKPLRLLDSINDWIEAEAETEQAELQQSVYDAVLCWLVTSDVSEYEMRMRRAAADRIASVLDEGAAASADRLELTSTHQEQLEDNAWLLFEAWFRNRAIEFAGLSSDDHVAYIEARLDNVSNWGLERVLVSDGSGAEAGAQSSQARLFQVVGELMAQLPDWVERAPGDERAAFENLAGQIKSNLMPYLLKKALPDLLRDIQ